MSKKTDKQLAVAIEALVKAINRLAASNEAMAPRFVVGGGGYPPGTWTSHPLGGPNVGGGHGGGIAGMSAIVRNIGSGGGGAGAAAEIPA